MKRIASLAFAGILAVASVTPALADTETVTVTPSQTFSGLPGTIAYPNVAVTQNADATPFTLVAGTANNPGGYTVKLALTDLTAGAGKTIPVSAHSLKITGTPQANTTVVSTFANAWGNWAGATGVATTIFSSTQGQAVTDSMAINLRLTPGAAVVPATYSGTATFTFALN